MKRIVELEFVENRKGGILRFKVDAQEFNGYDDVLREEGLKYRMCVSADHYNTSSYNVSSIIDIQKFQLIRKL